jgi:hypothetical protein
MSVLLFEMLISTRVSENEISFLVIFDSSFYLKNPENPRIQIVQILNPDKSK